MNTVGFSKQAKKEFEKLPNKEQKKVVRRINLLKVNSLSGKKLSGELKQYRSLRAWPYRVLYRIAGKNVYIVQIIHRQGAYKK